MRHWFEPCCARIPRPADHRRNQSGKNLGLLEREAMLLIEFHGTEEMATRELKLALDICKKHGASDLHEAKDDDERKKLWAGRKGAYPSLATILAEFHNRRHRGPNFENN